MAQVDTIYNFINTLPDKRVVVALTNVFRRSNTEVNSRVVTTATATIAGTQATLLDKSIICNFAGTVTLTLPSAVNNPGKTLYIRTITVNTVVSASSNVVPSVGGAAGTAILAATAGKWAKLRSDGTNWQVECAN